jgi:hypothetical protein
MSDDMVVALYAAMFDALQMLLFERSTVELAAYVDQLFGANGPWVP